LAWTLLAFTYFSQATNGWANDRLAALQRARQLDDKLLQLDPEFEGAYRLRARLELTPDLPEYDPDAALADARKSVELAPNDEYSHLGLGNLLLQLGRFDEATAEFATILRLNPHPPLPISGFHAIALSATGQYEQAVAEIAAAIAANPKNPFGPHDRGVVEAFAQHYAEAAVWLERAHEFDPDSAIRAYRLAAVYDQLGRVDDAISLLDKGPPRWRNVPEIRLWLALSYALAGRKEQAAAEFGEFRALAPKYTISSTRGWWSRFLTPQFFDRIAALSREYGIPEK
jgi:tetratricopeptide (TPR) repeat protein